MIAPGGHGHGWWGYVRGPRSWLQLLGAQPVVVPDGAPCACRRRHRNEQMGRRRRCRRPNCSARASQASSAPKESSHVPLPPPRLRKPPTPKPLTCNQRPDVRPNLPSPAAPSYRYPPNISIMVNWSLCAALLTGVAATVAPGFPVRGAPDLNVTWDDTNVSPPGELLPRPRKTPVRPIRGRI